MNFTIPGSTSALPPESDGPSYDFKTALQRMDGDQALMFEIAEIFRTEVDERMSVLHAAFAARDAVAVSRVAHMIKGEAANFSAGAVVRLAVEVEQFAGDGNIDAAASIRPQLEYAVRRLSRELATLMAGGIDGAE